MFVSPVSSTDYSSDVLIKVPPFHYLHVQDRNTNITRIVKGPTRFTCLDDLRVVCGPQKMVVIPPTHYCIVSNPTQRDEQGNVLLDEHGQAKLRHGESEVRLEQDPFPLYPGNF